MLSQFTAAVQEVVTTDQLTLMPQPATSSLGGPNPTGVTGAMDTVDTGQAGGGSTFTEHGRWETICAVYRGFISRKAPEVF